MRMIDGLVILAVLGAVVWYRFFWTRRRRWIGKIPVSYQRTDPAMQIHLVSGASFYKKTVMNKSEYKVFKTVENIVHAANKGYRVFAQTSLGEIIGSEDQKAFECVNSKRVDILVIDPFGKPAAAVEYQGDGHYQGHAAVRDTVKREALRKAGVAYVEIMSTEGEALIRHKVSHALGWPLATS